MRARPRAPARRTLRVCKRPHAGALAELRYAPAWRHHVTGQGLERSGPVLSHEQAASSSAEINTSGRVYRNWIFKRSPV